MILRRLYLDGHRSVEDLAFEAGQITVLFGRNNAGKTNILQAIASLFAPDAPWVDRRTNSRASVPFGGAVVDLEPGVPFDDAVADALTRGHAATIDGPVSLTAGGAAPGSLDEYEEWESGMVDRDLLAHGTVQSPSPHPLMLDWRFDDLHARVESQIAELASTEATKRRGDWPWLEMVKIDDDFGYRVPAATQVRVGQLASLASDLLPDFVDGAIGVHVTVATLWGQMPKVQLEYLQRNLGQCADPIDAAGEGAARWMAAAVEIALHIMAEHPEVNVLRDQPDGAFSGHVLLVDEPEAHLHPSAVASIVRWCRRMVTHGFAVVVASHHEEFLRAASEDVTLVHVTRDPREGFTRARSLPLATSTQLCELADHVGMHPASALSLHRAILFVEGPLDVAVLDEYGGQRLDLAGVRLIPIHGTRNLEGLVAAEVVSGLGIRQGILTDATDTDTMDERSNKKRSSEEKKVLRIREMAKAKGLPVPTAFGVHEADLLFALPTAAIRQHYLGGGPLPEWGDLVDECRQALGKSPSESVNWKKHAADQYNLPLDTEQGVRQIVRALDLAGVRLPSIAAVLESVVAWAAQER